MNRFVTSTENYANLSQKVTRKIFWIKMGIKMVDANLTDNAIQTIKLYGCADDQVRILKDRIELLEKIKAKEDKLRAKRKEEKRSKKGRKKEQEKKKEEQEKKICVKKAKERKKLQEQAALKKALQCETKKLKKTQEEESELAKKEKAEKRKREEQELDTAVQAIKVKKTETPERPVFIVHKAVPYEAHQEGPQTEFPNQIDSTPCKNQIINFAAKMSHKLRY